MSSWAASSLSSDDDGRLARAVTRPEVLMTEPTDDNGDAALDTGRERWRQTTRAAAMRGQTERRPVVPDDLRHPHRRPVHTRRYRRPRRGPRPGRPGEFPFTRGVQPTMYRGRLWTMRQYAGFSTAADTNERFRYLLVTGPDGSFGGLRPADPDGLRLGRAGGGRGGGPRGRAHQHHRGHGDPARRPARWARSRPR